MHHNMASLEPLSSLAVAETDRSSVRLRTLIILRWLAVLGQSAAIFFTYYYLELRIEFGLCLLAICASVITNLVAMVVYPETKRLIDREVLLTLLFDLTQLAFLLYLTGGLNNPFAVLILAPVTVSAMTLRGGPTLFLSVLAMGLVTVLANYHLPLRNELGFVLRMPQLFIIGFWVAMLIGIVFLAVYASRVTAETHSMSQALLATQMALAREQKLTDLGGVVAAAAHELGTPLATIKLVSAELLDELEGDQREDAALIREQADRCRDILRSMGRAGKDDLHLRTAPLNAIIEESAEPHKDRGKEVSYKFGPFGDGLDKVPTLLRRPEIIHGLRNLVQNAVDFSDNQVWIEARWSTDTIQIRVTDDGPGYPAGLLGRIGDPFLRRRKTEDTPDQSRPEYEGMGLGLFIAKTLLERSGGQMRFANGAAEGTSVDRRGAIAEVSWPHASLVSSPSEALGENQPISI